MVIYNFPGPSVTAAANYLAVSSSVTTSTSVTVTGLPASGATWGGGAGPSPHCAANGDTQCLKAVQTGTTSSGWASPTYVANTSYISWCTSSVNYNPLQLGFVTANSATGSTVNTAAVRYSNTGAGGPYMDIGAVTVATTSPTPKVFTLPVDPAMSNNPNLCFRLYLVVVDNLKSAQNNVFYIDDLFVKVSCEGGGVINCSTS